MKSRKKYFIIGAAILLFALLAGVSFIAACGPPGFCDTAGWRIWIFQKLKWENIEGSGRE